MMETKGVFVCGGAAGGCGGKVGGGGGGCAGLRNTSVVHVGRKGQTGR